MTKEEFEKGEDIAERRRWEAALRDPSCWRPLPTGFADRVIAAISGERHVELRPSVSDNLLAHRIRRMPRWALMAASLVLMAGFVFAATIMVDAVTAKDGDIEGIEGTQETEGMDGRDALAATETGDPRSEMGGTRPIASSEIPSEENPPTSNNQPENEKGETTMNIKQKAALTAAAVAVAGLAPPAAAGVTSATSSAMASFSSFVANSAQTPTSLEGGFHSFVSQSVDTDTLPQFNSREPRGTKIILR